MKKHTFKLCGGDDIAISYSFLRSLEYRRWLKPASGVRPNIRCYQSDCIEIECKLVGTVNIYNNGTANAPGTFNAYELKNGVRFVFIETDGASMINPSARLRKLRETDLLKPI